MSNRKEQKFILYMHTNKINGKKYIGITCLPPNTRFRNGNGYKHSAHFYSAIQKYGWNNFEHEILLEDMSATTAAIMEMTLILFYKTTDKNYGYNSGFGGEGIVPDGKSDEVKENMSRGMRHSKRSTKYIYNGIKEEYWGLHFLDICEMLTLSQSVVSSRIRNYGWSMDEALGFVERKSRKKGKPSHRRQDRFIYHGRIEKYNNKHIADICKEINLDPSMIRSRIKKGLTFDQALGFEEIDDSNKKNIYFGIKEQYHGKYFKDICKEIDLNYSTFSGRIRKNWTVDEAFGFIPRKPYRETLDYTYSGIKTEYLGMEISKICLKIGLNSDMVRSRIRQLGWTIDEALEFVPRQKNPNYLMYEGNFKEYFGKQLVEVCKILNKKPSLIRQRIKSGQTVDEALDLVKSNRITRDRIYDGCKEEYYGMKIAEICEIIGMDRNFVQRRIHSGFTVDEALEFVPNSKLRKKKNQLNDHKK